MRRFRVAGIFAGAVRRWSWAVATTEVGEVPDTRPRKPLEARCAADAATRSDQSVPAGSDALPEGRYGLCDRRGPVEHLRWRRLDEFDLVLPVPG